MVVENKSIEQLMAAQTNSTNQLITFMGERITEPVTVDGTQISVNEQKRQLSQIANKSTLVSDGDYFV